MEIKDFFRFRSDHRSSTFQGSAVNIGRNKDGVSNRDNLILGKYEGINFPVGFKEERGKKLVDILGTGWPNLYLISDRMKLILEENKLTGWKTFPITVYDKKKNEILGYHGFSVTGRCGPIDYTKAEIIETRAIPEGPLYKAYKGLYVGLDKWDGSDFFIPENSRCFIINTKTAEILKEDKITNIQLDNLTEIETPLFIFLDENT